MGSIVGNSRCQLSDSYSSLLNTETLFSQWEGEILRCTQSNVCLCGHVSCSREYHMISLLSLPKQRNKF